MATVEGSKAPNSTVGEMWEEQVVKTIQVSE